MVGQSNRYGIAKALRYYTIVVVCIAFLVMVLLLPIQAKNEQISTLQPNSDHVIPDQKRVIVVLNDPASIEHIADQIRTMSTQQLHQLRHEIRIEVVESLQDPLQDQQITHVFESFNGFSAQLTHQQVQQLLESDNVAHIIEDEKVSILLSNSVPHINATQVWNMTSPSIKGQGQTVCVIDSGVDYTHPDLGGCFGEGCKVIGGYDFHNNNADPMDDNGHGTHVAGIVASQGETYRGVAPHANILALKALDHQGIGYMSNVIASIEYCTQRKDSHNVSVISMSLGAHQHTSYCNNIAAASAINAAVNAGITVVVATGNTNDDWPNPVGGIASPSCVESVIRVTATDVSDVFGSYAFRHGNFQDILAAPGTSIISMLPNGNYGIASGTSMAAPHVSGVIALINDIDKRRAITRTPHQIWQILNMTGVRLHDVLSGATYTRIDAYNAIIATDQHPPQVIDTTANTSAVTQVEVFAITAQVIDDLSGVDSVFVQYGHNNPLEMEYNGSLYKIFTDTSSLGVFEPGNFSVQIIAQDRAGNVNDSVYVTLTLEQGSINITNMSAVPNYVTSSMPVVFQAHIQSEYPLEHVKVANQTMQGNLSQPQWFNATNTTMQLGCQELEGICIFALDVQDVQGNIRQEIFSVTVDDLAPRVIDISTDRVYVQSNQTVQITAIIQEINVTQATVNGVALNDTGSYYQLNATPDQLGCTIGVCVLQVNVTDGMGRWNDTEFTTITIDDSILELIVQTPTNGSWVRTSTPPIQLTVIDDVSEIAYCTIELGNFSTTTTIYNNTPTRILAIGAALDQGVWYNLSISCQDQAGNTNSTTMQVRSDTHRPTTTLTYDIPSAQYNWTNQPVTITINATDMFSGVASTVWMNSTGQWEQIHETLVINQSVPDNSIRFRSIDAAGNSEPIQTKHIFIDRSPPIIDSVLISREIGAPQDVIEMKITARDEHSGLYGYPQVAIDGELINTTLFWEYYNVFQVSGHSTQSTYRLLIPLPEQQNTTTIDINISDRAGNIAHITREISINSTHATIDSFPLGNIVENNTIGFIGIGPENTTAVITGNISGRMIVGNQELILTNTTNTIHVDELSYVIFLINKSMSFTIFANNSLSNMTQHRWYEIDTQPPAIQVLQPVYNASVHGDVHFAYNITDQSRIDTIRLQVSKDNISVIDTLMPTNNQQYIWNSRFAQDGVYTVRIEATDQFNQTATHHYTVVLNNTDQTYILPVDDHGIADFSMTNLSGVIEKIDGLALQTNVSARILANSSLIGWISDQYEPVAAVEILATSLGESVIEILLPNQIDTNNLSVLRRSGNITTILPEPIWLGQVHYSGKLMNRVAIHTDSFSSFVLVTQVMQDNDSHDIPHQPPNQGGSNGGSGASSGGGSSGGLPPTQHIDYRPIPLTIMDGQEVLFRIGQEYQLTFEGIDITISFKRENDNISVVIGQNEHVFNGSILRVSPYQWEIEIITDTDQGVLVVFRQMVSTSEPIQQPPQTQPQIQPEPSIEFPLDQETQKGWLYVVGVVLIVMLAAVIVGFIILHRQPREPFFRQY